MKEPPLLALIYLTSFVHGFFFNFCKLFPHKCSGMKDITPRSPERPNLYLVTTSGPSLHNPNPLPIRVVEPGFITPAGYHSKFSFHFNDSVKGDWFKALEYCKSLKSEMVEVQSKEDALFLRSYVKNIGDFDWWLGLRRTQSCRCTRSNSKKTTQPIHISSQINSTSILLIHCPSKMTKICDPFFVPWVWIGSETNLGSFIDWYYHEPKRNRFCAVLRRDFKFTWASDFCNASKSPRGHQISPICMKPVQDTPKVKSSTSFTPLRDETHCFDNNVIYRGAILRKSIQFVPNARRCSMICRGVKGCKYWIWRGDLISRLCILKKSLRKKKFRFHLPGSVAGKMINCRASSHSKDGPCYVSYNTELIKSEIIDVKNGIMSPQDCLDHCKHIKPLCRSFSWTKGSESKSNCTLSSSIAEDGSRVFAFRLGGITGVYARDECFGVSEDKSQCTCKSFDYDYYGDRSNEEEGKDGGIAKGCAPLREFAFCPIVNPGTEASHDGPIFELIESEACIEMGVRYSDGQIIATRDHVKSAEKCRMLCVEDCKYWSWFKGTFKCILRSEWEFYKERFNYAVSGNTIGPCHNTLSLSSLKRCACLPLDEKDSKKRVKLGKSIYENVNTETETCMNMLVLKCGPQLSIQTFIPRKIH